jgi:hypothetical protein
MIRRVLRTLLKPGQEWPQIKETPLSVSQVFFSYALAFAAVSSVIRFLAGFLYGHYKRPFSGWSWAVVQRELLFCFASLLLSLVIAYFWGRLIYLFAPVFSSRRSHIDSWTLAVFSMIPYWLGGVFYLIPREGWILKVVLGFYGLYILYRGFAAGLLDTPRAKVPFYFLLSSVLGLGLIALAEVLLRLLFTAWGVIKIG